MKAILKCLSLIILLLAHSACEKHEQPVDMFAQPERGFTSIQPAENWQHSLVTGNGTTGALIRGEPYDETITLSHESLYPAF